MQDIVDKVDRLKALMIGRKAGKAPSIEEMDEMAGMAIDALGELLANSRRIAVALEKMANKPEISIKAETQPFRPLAPSL